MWDGTTIIRPSLALAHLLELAEAEPQDAMRWQKLGTLRYRLGAVGVVEALLRAHEVDDAELGGAMGLLRHYTEEGTPAERDTWLVQAVARYPKAKAAGKPFESPWLPYLVERIVEWGDVAAMRTLTATWMRGGLQVESTAYIFSIPDNNALERFLESADLVSLSIGEVLPESRPSALEMYLERLDNRVLPDEKAPRRLKDKNAIKAARKKRKAARKRKR